VKLAGARSEIRDGGGAPSLPALLAPLAFQEGKARRSSKAPRLDALFLGATQSVTPPSAATSRRARLSILGRKFL